MAPGKVLRGSLPRWTSPGFSPFARSILEKIDRGVVLLDAMGVVVDANSIARQVLTHGNGLLLRNGRFTFADAEIEDRFESVEETAAELQLSLNTVRTHLKQIFSKCGVQSQAELLHTLALGPHSF